MLGVGGVLCLGGFSGGFGFWHSSSVFSSRGGAPLFLYSSTFTIFLPASDGGIFPRLPLPFRYLASGLPFFLRGVLIRFVGVRGWGFGVCVAPLGLLFGTCGGSLGGVLIVVWDSSGIGGSGVEGSIRFVGTGGSWEVSA